MCTLFEGTRVLQYQCIVCTQTQSNNAGVFLLFLFIWIPLQSNVRLTSFDLSRGLISDDIAYLLASAIRSNETLAHIVVDLHDIALSAAEDLARAIEVCLCDIMAVVFFFTSFELFLWMRMTFRVFVLHSPIARCCNFQ